MGFLSLSIKNDGGIPGLCCRRRDRIIYQFSADNRNRNRGDTVFPPPPSIDLRRFF